MASNIISFDAAYKAKLQGLPKEVIAELSLKKLAQEIEAKKRKPQPPKYLPLGEAIKNGKGGIDLLECCNDE